MLKLSYQIKSRSLFNEPLLNLVWLLIIIISTTSHASAHTKIKVYYDYRVFTEARETGEPKNPVSASNLLLTNAIEDLADIEFVPTIRLFNELEANPNVPLCALFKLKTAERAEGYAFSLPISFLSNNRLFLRRGLDLISPELLDENGAVSDLVELFGPDSTERIMLWEHISYGEAVDQAFTEIPSRNKQVIQVESSHGSLLKMIDRGRTDYAIIYPSEVADFEREFHDLDLKSYPIAGMPLVSTGHLMCTKNPASKAFLAQVDTIIRDLYQSTEFIEASTLGIADVEADIITKEIQNVASH